MAAPTAWLVGRSGGYGMETIVGLLLIVLSGFLIVFIVQTVQSNMGRG